MKSLHSLSNQVGGLPAQTDETFAHRFGSAFSRFGQRNATSVPSELFIGNPPSLPTHWSDPYSGFTLTVDNCESPLCLEIEHLTVGNQFGSQRIDNFDHFVSENKFWSHPYDVGNSNQNDAEYQFKEMLGGVGNNKEAISGKKNYQSKRYNGPYEITSGSKCVIHRPIIAGKTK